MGLPNAAAFELHINPKRGLSLVAAVLVIAVLYVATGTPALLLALPPGYATAIFPPAGIAVGVAFIRGRSLLPGVLLGSFGLNLWFNHSSVYPSYPASYIAAALVALASTLQAGS